MESWREGSSCHEELRSRRVVAVCVDSVGEGISVRKVTPPGFVMILWEIRDSEHSPWGRKGKEGTRMLSGLLKRRGSYIYTGDWCSGELEPHFSKWTLGRSQAGWRIATQTEGLLRTAGTKCFPNSLAASVGGSSPSSSIITWGLFWANRCVLLGLFSRRHADTKTKPRESAFLCSKECLLLVKNYVVGGVSVGVGVGG